MASFDAAPSGNIRRQRWWFFIRVSALLGTCSTLEFSDLSWSIAFLLWQTCKVSPFFFNAHTGTRCSTSPHKTDFSLICQGQQLWISAMVLAVHLTWLAAVVFMIGKKWFHQIRINVKKNWMLNLDTWRKNVIMMIFNFQFQFWNLGTTFMILLPNGRFVGTRAKHSGKPPTRWLGKIYATMRNFMEKRREWTLFENHRLKCWFLVGF